MEHIYRFRLFAMSLILTLLSAVVLMAQTEPSDNEKIFTKWENVPFFIWQGEKHFEYNYTADNKAVVTNYGAPVYSLPKNLPVTVLARYYEGGDRFYYIMLPDGSLGYVPSYALDEVEISYSNKWKGTSVHYDGWVKGNKKVGNKIYAKYGWQSPEVTVKTDKGNRKIPLNHTLVRTNDTKWYKVEMDKHVSELILFVGNPKDIENLVGHDKKFVENRFGKAKTFVGDALTDVGYAYSYYQNIAIKSFPERYKLYGLAVYYNKDMNVVDAAFMTGLDGKFKDESISDARMPDAPGQLCGRVDVSSGHMKLRGIQSYNPNKQYQLYDAHDKSLIYTALINPAKVWHLALALLCLSLLVFVPQTIVITCTKIGSNTAHEVFSGFVTCLLWFYSIYVFWAEGPVWAILYSFFILFAIGLPTVLVGFLTHEGTRCPYCNKFKTVKVLEYKILRRYKEVGRQDEYIRSGYDTVYNKNFMKDVANATPYKNIWISKRVERRLYRKGKKITNKITLQPHYKCSSCNKDWYGTPETLELSSRIEKGGTYWREGNVSDVQRYSPDNWEVIEYAERHSKD